MARIDGARPNNNDMRTNENRNDKVQGGDVNKTKDVELKPDREASKVEGADGSATSGRSGIRRQRAERGDDRTAATRATDGQPSDGSSRFEASSDGAIRVSRSSADGTSNPDGPARDPYATVSVDSSHPGPWATYDPNGPAYVDNPDRPVYTGDDPAIDHPPGTSDDDITIVHPPGTSDDDITIDHPPGTPDDDITIDHPPGTPDDDDITFVHPPGTPEDDDITFVHPPGTPDDDDITIVHPPGTPDDNGIPYNDIPVFNPGDPVDLPGGGTMIPLNPTPQE